MNEPAVSIVVPCYNVESFLGACLESILTTNLSNKELIIVNDGSTDGTLQVAVAIQQKYPDKISVHTIPNGGMSAARNYGFSQAKGKYVIFIDSDDVILGPAVDILYNKAEVTGADIVVGDYYEFWENPPSRKERLDKSYIPQPLVGEEEKLMSMFSIQVSYAIWNKMYRSDFLRNKQVNFLNGYWFEDLDFVFRAFYFANRIEKADTLFYGYRQRAGSIMKTIQPKMLDKIKVMDILGDFLQSQQIFSKYRSEYYSLYFKMGLSILYACFKWNADPAVRQEVINGIFESTGFQHLRKSGEANAKLLTLKEKIIYYLVRSRVLNPKTTSWAMAIAN